MITTYRLTDVELAYARAGELHRIPTADHRDPETLTATFPQSDPTNKAYTGQYQHLTRAELHDDIQAGKTVKQMAEEYGIPRGSLSAILMRLGLSTHKRGPRR